MSNLLTDVGSSSIDFNGTYDFHPYEQVGEQ